MTEPTERNDEGILDAAGVASVRER